MKYNESVGRYDLDLDDFGSKVLLHGPCCKVMLICHEVHSTQLVVTAWVYPVQVSLHMREVIQPATEQVGIQRSGRCSDFLGEKSAHSRCLFRHLVVTVHMVTPPSRKQPAEANRSINMTISRASQIMSTVGFLLFVELRGF